ncbi:Remorin C-terminal protein [Dioscorea alata]|uniref:Remorin C-terminal protein n=1 Tax=Dioscorea alata TaxID=55571 RepID=A0ACB7UGI4_DIOAL|nr:Remorin C-terminal protein [Dioscorea alata]
MTMREEVNRNKKKNNKKNEKQQERVSKSKAAAAAAFLTCHSSNRKRLHHLHPHPQHQHHLRWSTTVSDSEPDTTTVTRSLPSSDFLLMHMTSRANNNNNACCSSLASCPAFSLASLDDKRPSTPSPVCSPLSSDLLLHHTITTTPPHHHHPDDHQSICAMTNGCCKKLVVGDEVSPLHKIIREGGEGGGEKQSWTPKSNGSAASRLSRSACRYLQCDKEIIIGDNNCEDGGRVLLPVLVEEKEDKGCNKGDHHLPPPTQSSHFSADDDLYYTGSSSGGRGSEEYDGNFENEITVEKEERLRPTRDRTMNGIVVATDIRTEVEAKLNAWKEAKTYKLLNSLRNEEAAIAEWERKEMEKAKIQMKRLEMKLAKQRERAMMRMHRKIGHVKEHAEQKMLKERETTARKISSVSKSFDGINTWKISWKLICC